MRNISFLFPVVVVSLLGAVACGGSGDSERDSVNPNANAGAAGSSGANSTAGSAGIAGASGKGGSGAGGGSAGGGGASGQGGEAGQAGGAGEAGAGGAGGAGAGGAAGGAGSGGAGAAGGGGAGGSGGAPDATSWGWRAAAPLTTPRQSGACASREDGVYVLGGMSAGKRLADVSRYDPSTDTWETLPALPRGNCCFGAAWLGGKLYAAGGYEEGDSSKPSADLFVYDPASKQWNKGPAMPTSRANVSVFEWGGKLAVAGGRAGDPWEVVASIEIFDPASGAWSTSSTPLPVGREAAAVVARGQGLVAAGGYVPESVNMGEAMYGTASVDLFSGQTWASGPTLLLARGQVASGLVGGAVVVVGGWGPSGHTDAAEVLAPGASSWAALPPLPTARAGACAASHGGALYVIGGGQYGGAGKWTPLTSVEVLEPKAP